MNILGWMNRHKFEVHVLAFCLMTLPPVPLYFAARHEAAPWILGLLGLVVLGNLLALAAS